MSIFSRNRLGITIIFVLIAVLIAFYAFFLRKVPVAWHQQRIPSPPPVPSVARFEAVTPMNEKTSSLKENGWVLVVQTVKTAQDAQRLVLTLQQKGFRAYARPLSKSEGQVWRVFVGPELNLEVIKALAQQLQHSQALSTQIVPFNPLI
ncbi:SPOR domain-containing protein [Rickettsiella massiliensis]|uniref:SPOR domain-containing protein n=1 Tax=Rickettsiella massiliensis TaxID=676517 RepID=UPI00029AFEEE|nr:SPOR domain-containing protein [Rickettsiella massiliensis]